MKVSVIGGGLAGSEAAWQVAQRGIAVDLYEMRPQKQTPAHKSSDLAELVCSNSLGSKLVTSGGGLLKSELTALNSLILTTAYQCEVPAGGALAVDRQKFARMITNAIAEHPLINLVRSECKTLPDGLVIIATGPLSSPAMTDIITKLTDQDQLYFYDAAAPIVTGDSLDYDLGFWAARYNKGSADYFNCPMDYDQYQSFYHELINAEQAPLHSGIEDIQTFEGCLPIEIMAKRGIDTLRYGPLRPVGLIAPDGNRPYAVVQLRQENTAKSLFNLVGFQTRLKWGEQKRVFQMIPALRKAEFVRYGVMHRNTFVNSPEILKATYQLREHPRIFLAGQITGVEGYVESVSSGLVAGINATKLLYGHKLIEFPEETMIGALARYITTAGSGFQPINANFGILPPLAEPVRKKHARKQAYADRSQAKLSQIVSGL